MLGTILIQMGETCKLLFPSTLHPWHLAQFLRLLCARFSISIVLDSGFDQSGVSLHMPNIVALCAHARTTDFGDVNHF